MSIESIIQQSSSFVPVVERMKFTDTSFSMFESPPVMRRAVKYPLVPSGLKSALSMTTDVWSKRATFSSDEYRKLRYWEGDSPSDSICSTIRDSVLE